MAKPRKPKTEEQKTDNSEAVVRHQKLCLSIDMEKRLVYGYTELEIAIPDNGVVGLHADNLAIERVTVDGEPAEFEVFPHYVQIENQDRWSAVSSATSAADAAGSVYLSSLERELVPNLLIMCSKHEMSPRENGPQSSENGLHSSEDPKQNVKMVRVDYWVEKAETGIHFEDNVLHTDSQIRRARCWFPSMDDGLQRCCFDLEFTVGLNFVAVSSGKLLCQVLSNDSPPRKTFVYKLDIPVAAQWISLAVAPFEIFPDRHSGLLSYMCLSGNSSRLRNTVGFFHTAFSYYEEYLSASFPFGSYNQVFIAPEMAVSGISLGASMTVFSSHVLFDEKVIDQTLQTRIKLASALARQWFGVFITPESPNDEWLMDGLAGFLTDLFIKRFLGNNEARYRRYKENCAVCKADDSGATALSPSGSSKDLYGTQCIGFHGKIRSWKSVAVLQMLEKQMGPESFRKILQSIVTRPSRTLSTKEFRHSANKVGNLERPFLKEFFPRWVGSCGCPVLRTGFSYNKRKNIVELAVMRGCTATSESIAKLSNGPDSENRDGDVGWPGMMSIRVHELDGMYDHPILPMAGDTWQLLELHCHSRLAAKRFQKQKKGSKPDGSDDNGDAASNIDMRSNSDSPLLWLRADPEMEYLAEINFNQPVQMWINQLEKDKDVVAQAQAIAMLGALPHFSFSIISALNNLLSDNKAFWRVRIEAAFALASSASEETDWAGLLHLIKFYKNRRFDANIGLPKQNNFHDFQEYFVLEVIPNAIAMVRSADKKSPIEAVEFVLQLLKYNDNNGNPFSDVFWLGALVQSIGELEFGQQSFPFLSSILKHIDRLLQFDRLMPSYNGILMISCIRSLTRVALKLSDVLPITRVIQLIEPFRDSNMIWQVRIEASRALLDLEFYCKGINAALVLFIKFLGQEPSLRGQAKLGVHLTRLGQIRSGSHPDDDVKSETLASLLRLLESPLAFNNIVLRHYLFCIIQVLARRPPTLYGVPRDESMRMSFAETCSELKNIFAALVKQSKPGGTTMLHSEPYVDILDMPPPLAESTGYVPDFSHPLPTEDAPNVPPPEPARISPKISPPEPTLVILDAEPAANISKSPNPEPAGPPDSKLSHVEPTEIVDIQPKLPKPEPVLSKPDPSHPKPPLSSPSLSHNTSVMPEASKEADVISNGRERRKVVKIRVKQSAPSSRAASADNNPTTTLEKAPVRHNDGPTSSISVDAPQRNFTDVASTSNQNMDDVNSCHDRGSRMTASIGSARIDDLVRELQCTADSSKAFTPLLPTPNDANRPQKFVSLQTTSVDSASLATSDKKKSKKDKDNKRKREDSKSRKDNPEYSERKRLKKEKKKKEKELKLAKATEEAKLALLELHNNKRDEIGTTKLKLSSRDGVAAASVEELDGRRGEGEMRRGSVTLKQSEPSGSKIAISRPDPSEVSSAPKFRIKIKNRMLNK